MAKKSRAFDKSKYQNWIDPATVQPYERNAKIHTDKQVQNIVNSIERFGWQQDAVLTADNVLVIGHGRRLAALKIGCEMPYHRIDKKADALTDADIRELRIADNQTNAETGMDFSVREVLPGYAVYKRRLVCWPGFQRGWQCLGQRDIACYAVSR